MKRFVLLTLLVAVCTLASAQGVPTHEQYVKIGGSTPWYTAYGNWSPGYALYSSDSQAAENEEFFISRVKPRSRFTFTGTQVKENLNPERKVLWWCPLGVANNGNWNGIPAYYFGGEVYSMWSYTDIYGNWTAPLIQAPAAFLDACHKNGVRSGVVASVPFGASPSKNDGSHGSNINALVTGGYDKLLKYLRYYGVDGVGFNSEFSWDLLDATGFKNLMGNCYSNAASYGVPFNNAWYSFTSNDGDYADYSVLNSGCVQWFHYNGKKVSDAYFLNYNWGSSQLNTSVSTANGQGRSGFDVYAGMDYQGRSNADWLALQYYNTSFGLWGAHNMNMIYESRGELGANPIQLQKTYQLISENSFTGSSYNPVNTPPISNILRHTSTATNFHGFSSFITARSTLTPQDGGTLATDPFVTYFNLGNGMFFKEEGVTTFDREWYNLGMQDYLPTWRWWWTKNFMGKNASDASTDMIAEFCWDDAWWGGSCLQISGATTTSYLQLFKTKYPLQNEDKFTIRYKVLSGTGKISITASSEANPTTEYSSLIVSSAKADDEIWEEKSIYVRNRGLKLNGETLAMIGLKFENTTSDFKILIGELSLTRGTSTTPGKPNVKTSKAMTRTYKGVDMKIIFDMNSNFYGSRQNYESIYNSQVKTWFYKIYTEQEGCSPVLCTATTSWAAYVVGAPYDLSKGGRIRIGVSAVALDGMSESAIAWGNWITPPSNNVVEGFSIDKPIIKAGEEFTVAFDDPTHAAATWVIKASENDAVKGTFNANSFTTSLNEEGIYDLYLTQNGTTEVYRGKIQISPAEVGALPKINTLTLKGSDDNDWIDVGEVTTFNYTGRSDADGYVSRGFALGEKAFGIPCGQLGFNKQTPFTLTFWLYINRFNHETDGTQFLNVRTASDPWPASDWGYIWSTFDADGKFHLSYRLITNAGEELNISNDFEFKPETWYHVAMVCGYTSNRTLELYINGKLVGSGTATLNLYDWKSSNVIMIGGRAYQRAGIDGTLDEVRLYKKSLSAQEIKNSMQHVNNVTDANFIGYWDFESEPQSNNTLKSTGYDKGLVASLYDPSTITNSAYKTEQITFAAGAPFISGTNYKIETLPSWKIRGASMLLATGDKAEGEAKAIYSETGDYRTTLTLSNGWGSDVKEIDVITVYPTGIEDVAIEEMQAFPNPFENEVCVSFVEDGVYTVEIYDNTGRMLDQVSLSATAGEAYPITVDGVSGIYFIKVKGDAGLLKVMKVAKK